MITTRPAAARVRADRGLPPPESADAGRSRLECISGHVNSIN